MMTPASLSLSSTRMGPGFFLAEYLSSKPTTAELRFPRFKRLTLPGIVSERTAVTSTVAQDRMILTSL
jgi:hypothetical protein